MQDDSNKLADKKKQTLKDQMDMIDFKKYMKEKDKQGKWKDHEDYMKGMEDIFAK